MKAIRYTIREARVKVTLTNLCASLEALRYSRACRNLEILDLVVLRPNFNCSALLKVRGEVRQEEEVSQIDMITHYSAVVHCNPRCVFDR